MKMRSLSVVGLWFLLMIKLSGEVGAFSESDLEKLKGTGSCSSCDLSGAILLGAPNLSGSNLSGSNLTGAQFPQANLTRANLAGSNLDGVFLLYVNLTGANLTGANLTRSFLAYSNLTGADLTGADLTAADLTEANLTGANLEGAQLTGADLTGANLEGAKLTGADLTGANLTGAQPTDLVETILVDQMGSDQTIIEPGEKLARDHGCIACHSLDGTPGVGPTWKGLVGKIEILDNGSRVLVDEDYLKESIVNPNAKVVIGFAPIMPPAVLTDDQLESLVAYITSISGDPVDNPLAKDDKGLSVEDIADMAGIFFGCETFFKKRKSKELIDWVGYRPEFERFLTGHRIIGEGGKVTPKYADKFWNSYNKIKSSPEQAEFGCGFNLLFWEGVRQGILLGTTKPSGTD